LIERGWIEHTTMTTLKLLAMDITTLVTTIDPHFAAIHRCVFSLSCPFRN
jgi:hypothetical protein